ncbi:PAS domain-containing protein [Pedobacter sp. JCM 36344]|uniref:PAS domain-containing protein n=1 Tax=Pedobacter sp. JCM 36344 TaxID=3374280 RepID=UPI00397CF503
MTHPADRHMLNVGQRRNKKGESLIHECRIIHKNGSIRWIENSIIPTLDGSGMLVKLGGIIFAPLWPILSG